jgi:seryl-tRNA synthetase
MIPVLAELPDFAWITGGAVVVFIVVAFGASIVLREMRELRSNLADEIGRQLESAKQAQPVAVQQPLIVTAHEKHVTREEHAALTQRLDDELGRERGARKKMHEEIASLQGDVKVLKSQNETQSRQLSTMDQKMDQVLLRLPRPS